MSGESASVVEVCAVAAAGTLVAARAVADATGAVLNAPGAALSAVARRMEGSYARHQQRQAALAAWEAAAREVVDRNSRLSVLAARPGGAPGLPAPLLLQDQSLQEQSLEQLVAWCTATDQALARVERALLAEAASAVSVTLASISEPEVSAATVLTEHATTGTAPPPELLEACSRILGGLTTEVSAADRAEVLAAVARVRDCTTPAERQGWLAELRVRVRQANGTAARHREQARTAATMLQALAESTAAPAAQLRAELEGVVAGHRALDPVLHQNALAACEQVRAGQEDAYVRDALTRALDKLGYEVDQGFDTFTGQSLAGRGTRLRLVRDRWPQHAVSLLVDGGEVRAMVVRTESAEGDDAERLDAEREQQWCADFEELRDQVASDGLRLDVQRLTPPGKRRVPVAARRQRPARRAEPQRQANKPEHGR
ncbi:MAG: hypothetical protein ABR608_07360 [Pseudonocardiaceae bacterium]